MEVREKALEESLVTQGVMAPPPGLLRLNAIGRTVPVIDRQAATA